VEGVGGGFQTGIGEEESADVEQHRYAVVCALRGVRLERRREARERERERERERQRERERERES